MNYVSFLEVILNLTCFKEITDSDDNEYVVFQNSATTISGSILDKTQFEAVENHVHLVEEISKNEYLKLQPMMRKIGNMLRLALKNAYPKKSFVVYVSLILGDSLTIRFHQQWKDEEFYYHDILDTEEEKMIILLSDNK